MSIEVDLAKPEYVNRIGVYPSMTARRIVRNYLKSMGEEATEENLNLYIHQLDSGSALSDGLVALHIRARVHVNARTYMTSALLMFQLIGTFDLQLIKCRWSEDEPPHYLMQRSFKQWLELAAIPAIHL